MKKFIDWIKNHLPTKRRLIQVYAALLYNCNIKGFITGKIYTGPSKNLCLPGMNCYSCPGAVGACPLGALQNALASSNTKAPYYIIGILALLGIMLGRTICGFLCPVGLGEELLYKIPSPKLRKSRVTRVLSYFKYVILLTLVIAVPLAYLPFEIPVPGFCKYICPAGTLEGALGLLVHPDNADLYAMLGPLFTWKFILLVLIVAASVFVYRAFCRFLCPLGAIYGFFNKIALLGVKVDVPSCTDCGMCINVCKMDVRHVGDHECINCGECISVCPTKAISWKGQKVMLHANMFEQKAAEKEAELMTEKIDIRKMATPVASMENTEDVAPMPEVEDKSSELQKTEFYKQALQKKVSARNKGLKIAACAMAGVLLAGSIVYYNFLEKEPEKSTLTAGDICAEDAFTVTTYYNSKETYSPADSRGKTTLLYFWDDSCNETIPELERFQKEYKKDVYTVAIHSSVAMSFVEKEIADNGWQDYDILFAQDSETDDVCALFGWTSLAKRPYTVLLDKDGKVINATTAEFDYDTMESVIFGDYKIGSEVGNLCFDFTVELLDNSEGNTYSLADSRGKITIVNFWATWCGPCIAELPYFNRVQEAYKEEVFVVAIDTFDYVSKEDAQAMVNDKPDALGGNWKDYSITFARDNGNDPCHEVADLLDIGEALPVTYILDQKGVIRFIRKGPTSEADLIREIDKILQAE